MKTDIFGRAAPIVFAVALFLPATIARADSGALAYAQAMDPISVDGDLSDWDADVPVYELGQALVGDTEARFRLAYNAADQALYVAMEVEDDTHILDEDSVDTWYLKDSHILYFDPEHSANGSAPFEFSAAGEAYRSIPEEKSWSVAQRTKHTEMASVAFARVGSKSIYEWRVGLGERALPGNVIGLDHIITDIDAPKSQDFSAVAMWGRFQAKGSRSGRLADVMLLPEPSQMGQVGGSIAWGEGTDGPDLKGYRVRITSATGAGEWIQLSTDEKGAFDIDLPAGEYIAASPFLIYDTPAKDGYDLRLKDAGTRRFRVSAGAKTEVGTLKWHAQGPLEIASKPGVLFDYDESRQAEVTAFIKRALDYYQVEGASIALLSGGKLAYARDFGVKNKYSGEAVDETTLFEAGSVTKLVFALAVNRLAERGVIDLDQPLYTYLPWEDLGEDPKAKLITARHVLSHQTGLPNWRGQTEDGKLSFKFTPGTSFSYSGEAFEYLGRVMVEVTGKSIDKILLDEALTPFGGDPANIVFFDDGTLIDRVAFGHDIDRPNTPQLPEYIAPAYSMQTNARALAPMMEAMLAGKGMTATTYDAMLTEQVLTPDPASSLKWPSYYGLGVRIMETRFGHAIGHTGLNGANNAMFEAYPEQGAGIIVLTNSDLGRQFYLDLREFLVVGRE